VIRQREAVRLDANSVAAPAPGVQIRSDDRSDLRVGRKMNPCGSGSALPSRLNDGITRSWPTDGPSIRRRRTKGRKWQP
jgi:hypothetical protein